MGHPPLAQPAPDPSGPDERYRVIAQPALWLDKDCPQTRPVHRPAAGKIIMLPEVGGLQVPPAIYSRPAIVVRVPHATSRAARLDHCLRLGERWSVSWASFSHDSAMRSQTALSLGLTALSDCWRQSSALSRTSSAVLKPNTYVGPPQWAASSS